MVEDHLIIQEDHLIIHLVIQEDLLIQDHLVIQDHMKIQVYHHIHRIHLKDMGRFVIHVEDFTPQILSQLLQSGRGRDQVPWQQCMLILILFCYA